MSNYVDQIISLATKRKSDQPVFIAVDGHSAAGKTTLAKKLAVQLPNSVLLHMDDFYRVLDEQERFAPGDQEGYELYFDWQHLKQEVLEPLAQSKSTSFKVYDWQHNTPGEEKCLAPSDFVIVEGCYSARLELEAFYAVVVLVETDFEERKKRLIERNENSQAWIDRWEAAELFYLRTTNLADRADVVVRNAHVLPD